jgi:hypothetical protein
MRLTAVVALVALCSAPALAADVRVKSKHDKVTLAGGSLECQKVGAEETLRAGAIGPGAVRVTLRRLGDAKAPPIAVKLMRDGREVGKLNVGGKPSNALGGAVDLAGPPLDKVVEIPAGPHTLFVEVGSGAGGVLVSFDEAHAAAPLVKAEPKPDAAAVAVAPKATPAAPKKDVKKADSKEPKPVARGTKLEEEDEPAPAPRPAAKLEDSDVQPTPEVKTTRASKLEDGEEGPSAQPAVAAAAPAPSDGRVRFFLGPRLGVAGQTQLAAAGPALGVTFRWAVAGPSSASGTRGLLVGLSADYVRYAMNLKVGASAALPAFSEAVTATSVPILLDATYCFGNPEQARLSPYLGLAIGAAVGSIQSVGPTLTESSGFAQFAFGAHAGLELPLGANRLGLEVRWLWARTGGSGTVQNLDVGGLLAQLSWRFGL